MRVPTPDADELDELLRRRLRALGWRLLLPQSLFGLPRWRSPGGQQLPEDEAFAELERMEKRDVSTLP